MDIKMKRTYRVVLALLALVLALSLAFAGCSSQNDAAAYVVSIAQTGETESGESEFTVTYSDGTTSTFTVKNGQNGEDGQDVTAADLYEEYKKQTGDESITYAEFLEKYLDITVPSDNSAAIASILRSAVRVYSEYRTTEYSSSGWGGAGVRPVDTVSYSMGGGVICEMNDTYTYIITNYHVVYSTDANEDNGSNIGRSFHIYPYGSSETPVNTGTQDEDGYDILDYGSSAVECEYIGGSASLDIAVLRASTEELLAVNDSVAEVTYADGYTVGETAIAVGNPEGEGMSVTEGIVSVDSEYINLSTDGTTRSHRSMRIDAALYEGNSGGGVFNEDGELIGIANAGDGTDQNINYAIPVSVARGAAENIIAGYEANGEATGVTRPTLGVTVSISNSKYVYDSQTSSGKITETVTVSEVTENSIAAGTFALQAGDVLTAFVINDTEYQIDRSFEVNDLLLTVRTGDKIAFKYERDGTDGVQTTAQYTLLASDFSAVA